MPLRFLIYPLNLATCQCPPPIEPDYPPQQLDQETPQPAESEISQDNSHKKTDPFENASGVLYYATRGKSENSKTTSDDEFIEPFAAEQPISLTSALIGSVQVSNDIKQDVEPA